MNRLFNSEFEVSLRLVLLLKTAGAGGLTVGRAAVSDYAAIYAKSCGIWDANLNGDSSYCFSEFATKRLLVSKALKTLVLNGLADVVPAKNGFLYCLSETGKTAAAKMNNLYSLLYIMSAKKALAFFKSTPDNALMDAFNVIASRSMEDGDE